MPAAPRRDELDPLGPESFTSAHDEFARLRAGCPVVHSEAYGGFWAVLDHRHVSDVLRRSGEYVTSVQNVVPKVAFTGRRPPLHLDPPEHTPYRQVLNRFFTADRVAGYRPMVRRRVVELIVPFIATGGDICREFSRRLPGHVFADLFKLSTEQAMAIKATSEVYNQALQRGDDEGVKQTSLELYDLARAIIASRQEHPLDPVHDITTALLHQRSDGAPLPAELVLGTIRQMIVVGMIAPSLFIGSMAVHLATHPELQARLRDDLALVPAAIEEYLRLLTPYRGFARTSVAPVELAGRRIEPGEPIALVYAAANRDPAVFPDPDEFVLDRPNVADHVAFGRGPHRCAGEGLARELLRITLEELLARTERFALAGEPVMTAWPEWGVQRAELELAPSSQIR